MAAERSANSDNGRGRPKKLRTEAWEENFPGTRNGSIYLRWVRIVIDAKRDQGLGERSARKKATQAVAAEFGLTNRRIQQIVAVCFKIYRSESATAKETGNQPFLTHRQHMEAWLRSRDKRAEDATRVWQLLNQSEYFDDVRSVEELKHMELMLEGVYVNAIPPQDQKQVELWALHRAFLHAHDARAAAEAKVAALEAEVKALKTQQAARAATEIYRSGSVTVKHSALQRNEKT